MQDWLKMTAGDLGRGIAKGAIDPVELTEVYLDAINAHPLRTRIYARTTPERARAEAMAARVRAQAGQRRSLLDGVPISWKDLFDTAGTVTEAGSLLLQDRVPDKDAIVVRNATALGLVCLGKTHMSELAFAGLGHNPSTATPPCVNDADAVSGGSSSGAAASVAFDLAPCGIGSDTGGSVRLPAAWNDLVGLKTTSGRLTLEGVVPLCLKFDTIGPLCRSVEDAALMLAALEGRQAADLQNASLKGKRFAVIETIALDDLHPNVKTAFDRSIAAIEAAGAHVEPISVPALADIMAVAGKLFTAEAYGLWQDVIEANPDKMYSEILARFRLGANVSGPEYVATWAALEAARQAWDLATSGFDATLAPTCAGLPPNLEKVAQDSDYYTSENLKALRNTRIGNLMGLCALTLPTGTPSAGLMMMCRPDCEDALLRLGAAVEKVLA